MQLHVDGKIEVYSVGPNFTRHGDEPIDEEDIAKLYDVVTGNLLFGHLVRAARQEEIRFLTRSQCIGRSRMRTRRAKERASAGRRDVNEDDSNSMAVRSRFVGREYRWKDPFKQGTFVGNSFEYSEGRETRLVNGTTSRTRRLPG